MSNVIPKLLVVTLDDGTIIRRHTTSGGAEKAARKIRALPGVASVVVKSTALSRA